MNKHKCLICNGGKQDDKEKCKHCSGMSCSICHKPIYQDESYMRSSRNQGRAFHLRCKGGKRERPDYMCRV